MSEVRTLVVDKTYQPISIVPLHTITWEAAINRVMNGMCDVVSEYDYIIKTQNPDVTIRKPAIIARKNFDGINAQEGVPFSKTALFYRDNCECQYCGDPLTEREITLDHVIPQADGGKTTWDNVVIACGDCNNRKGSRAPVNQWRPKNAPWKPDYWQFLNIRRKYPIVIDHESWVPFLQPWEGEIRVRKI